MHENFIEAQEIFIEYGARIGEVMGLSEGMAKIVAFMYINPQPASIGEICRRLDLTKGTVSVYLRMLEERKIIVRSWVKKKGRQKFYEINPRLWSDLIKDLKTRTRKRMELMENAIDNSVEIIQRDQEEYEGEDRLISKLLVERLEKIREINRLTTKVFEIFHPDESDFTETMRKIDIEG